MAQTPKKTIGSRAEVYHGTAHHTSGGLTHSDLRMNKWGRIVSKKMQERGRKLHKKYGSILEENRAPAFRKKGSTPRKTPKKTPTKRSGTPKRRVLKKNPFM